MKRREMFHAGLPLMTLPFAAMLGDGCGVKRGLVISCDDNNDIFCAVRDSGIPIKRFESPLEAVRAARNGGGALIFSRGYPEETTPIDDSVFAEAKKKSVKLFIEYPFFIPGLTTGKIHDTYLERGVIITDTFGGIEPMAIIYLHGCRFIPFAAEKPYIVVAKVAGFDRAVYGLADTETHPLLFEACDGTVLVAATKLSGCRAGRFAPADNWLTIWRWILSWVDPTGDYSALAWTPSVGTAYGKTDTLAPDAEPAALARGIEWYYNARQLVHSSWASVYDADARSWPDRVGPMPDFSWESGDGSLGLLEGFCSKVDNRGFQKVRWWRRCDCNAETAGAMALAGAALHNDRFEKTGAALCDWLFDTSIMTRGERANPASPSYGLFGWNDVERYWRDLNGYGVYYGDDNARALLGIMAAAASLKIDRWDEGIARCILGNFRTAGPEGFRRNRIDEPDLAKNGWRFYNRERIESFAPHYQAYLWACYLWAYRATGRKVFLDRAVTAIGKTMEAYPAKWHWTNGIQQERARMILPLAWLVAVDDTPEHREWLRFMAGEMLADQDVSGAIREEIGESNGAYGPPATNALYGTNEASLIHTNGDPLADLLYTTNFAFLGLHEAEKLTGEETYAKACDALAGFLVRIQVKSADHPELDGAWFRAFDYERWEHWASNSDAGWGVWSTETGWTQGWITAVLALRHLGVSLWDVTKTTTAGAHLDRLYPSMLG